MDFIAIEKKWQTRWDESKLYSFDKSRIDKKHYVLEMFSYPSASKLHVGHWYNYGPSDSYARFKRMQGMEVFQPMGFDAFGLPAENYAIKTGIHPSDSTLSNINTMEEQLKRIGASFDWDYELITCMPDYYKWTQWIFLQLFKHNLAYRKQAPVNWCPKCQTVLANEQVKENQCDRCSSEVTKRNLTQWFFKITDYAEELLSDLDKLDWPEKTKLMQKNWIGKSTGGEIVFDTLNNDSIKVFTTRADTLFGVSYVVLAPEHPLVEKLTTEDNKKLVEDYITESKKVNEIERLSTAREKSGVFTGSYCINPINGRKVEIWVADYVLYSYGTGAVMGVPSHDDRDFIFAKKYNLPIERVIRGLNGNDELPFTDYGIMCNSGEFDGLGSMEGSIKVIEKLNNQGRGELKTNYRLRDWLVSRQRYWGSPIPIIHCDKCGIVPVPEEDLPVLLPYNVEFNPNGQSPLLNAEEFINTTCPICKAQAKRDADTLDTFVCSSWYFLRYPDAHNDKEAFNKELINKMLPVDKYIGGSEHACMHLLYARFFTKALRDMGYLNFDEPFTSLVHQGIILGPDGMRMSKSHGNVISPDTYVTSYGSDIFRLYLMFGFSYIEGGPWNDDGIKAIHKFVERVERIAVKYKELPIEIKPLNSHEKEVNYIKHNAIRRVTDDLNNFSFNTAVARIMEYVNALYKYDSDVEAANTSFMQECINDLILMLAPFIPHIAEELNEMMGNTYSVFNKSYPVYDEKALIKDEIELVVQINSRIKGKIIVSNDSTGEEIENIVKNSSIVTSNIEDIGKIKKIIIIPKKLVNIVV